MSNEFLYRRYIYIYIQHVPRGIIYSLRRSSMYLTKTIESTILHLLCLSLFTLYFYLCYISIKNIYILIKVASSCATQHHHQPFPHFIIKLFRKLSFAQKHTLIINLKRWPRILICLDSLFGDKPHTVLTSLTKPNHSKTHQILQPNSQISSISTRSY